MTRDLDDGRNVVDDYLKRRGHIESSSAKRYMKALRGSVISLYEVSDVVPGKSFLARDLIRGGEPVRVIEKSGSETLNTWDHLAARLVQLGTEWHMGGGGASTLKTLGSPQPVRWGRGPQSGGEA